MVRIRLARNEGYSLLELMTAVAILGILATIAFPSLKRMQTTRAAKASATTVASMLNDARTAAQTEGTPHLVYFNTPEAPGADGECPALAVEVRDADHSYSLTPGDTTRELRLPGDACQKVKPLDQADASAEIATVPLPMDDKAINAPDVNAAAASNGSASGSANANGSANSGKGNANAGSGSGSAATPEVSETGQAHARSATVANSVVNGTTFPVDANDGRPVVAFSERGIPVDPANPTQWGSGAGGIYLTDGDSTVVAAVVAPLGDVQLRVFDSAAGDWR